MFRDAALLAASLQPLYALLYPVHTVVEVVQAVVHIFLELLSSIPKIVAVFCASATAGSPATGFLGVAPSRSFRSASRAHANTLL